VEEGDEGITCPYTSPLVLSINRVTLTHTDLTITSEEYRDLAKTSHGCSATGTYQPGFWSDWTNSTNAWNQTRTNNAWSLHLSFPRTTAARAGGNRWTNERSSAHYYYSYRLPTMRCVLRHAHTSSSFLLAAGALEPTSPPAPTSGGAEYTHVGKYSSQIHTAGHGSFCRGILAFASHGTPRRAQAQGPGPAVNSPACLVASATINASHAPGIWSRCLFSSGCGWSGAPGWVWG
jgi:hypothetical protein